MRTSTRVSGVVARRRHRVLTGALGRRARRRATRNCSISWPPSSTTRRGTSRRCRPSTGRRRPTDAALGIRARKGRVRSALKVAEFGLARQEAQKLAAQAPSDAEAQTLLADTLWSAGLFDEADRGYRTALALAPGLSRARASAWPARSPRRASCREALDEALAASAAVAAGRRHPRRHRRHLRAAEPVRRGRQRLHQLHQPAAQQGPQRKGRVGARPGAVPRVVRGHEAGGRGRGGPAHAAHASRSAW